MGIGPKPGTETCVVADYIHSCSWLLRVTGRGEYADRMERAFFNAVPACVSADWNSHAYYQSPNRFNLQFHWNLLRHNGTACCYGNQCRLLPNYLLHQWAATPDGGLAACLYGPCSFRGTVGKDVGISIDVETDYPFSEQIRINLSPDSDLEFPLHLRVPAWCTAPTVQIDGEPLKLSANPQGFLIVKRLWSKGNVVVLNLPMPTVARIGTTCSNGQAGTYGGGEPVNANRRFATLEHGPLLYALPRPHNIKPDKDKPEDYAYCYLHRQDIAVKLERKPMPATWSWAESPVTLTVPMYPCEWKETPDLPVELVKTQAKPKSIVLKPYGFTRGRLSMFPVHADSDLNLPSIVIKTER